VQGLKGMRSVVLLAAWSSVICGCDGAVSPSPGSNPALLADSSASGSAIDGGLSSSSSAGTGTADSGLAESLAEGNRCNPYLSHSECNSGLVCAGYPPSPPNALQPFVLIPFCTENYCCSVNSNLVITSTNPNCQPGCNGGAAAICATDGDPGACLLADGGSLQMALAADHADGGAASSE
jgi:hypothetical protein